MRTNGTQDRSKQHIIVFPLMYFRQPLKFSRSWTIILKAFLIINIINPRSFIKLIDESRNFFQVPDYNSFPILSDLLELGAVTQDVRRRKLFNFGPREKFESLRPQEVIFIFFPIQTVWILKRHTLQKMKVLSTANETKLCAVPSFIWKVV